jgi:succinate dehydrogenase/fumarate reductase cytochrome b subunit
MMVGILGLLFILLIISDYTKLVSLSEDSTNVFNFFMHQPISIVLPIVWLIFTYRLQYHFLSRHFYTDEAERKKLEEIRYTKDRLFLRSIGLTGSLILL